MQQPPTAAELLATVMEVLGDEVVPSLTGPVQHHARVAANLVAIVERELRLGGDAASTRTRRDRRTARRLRRRRHAQRPRPRGVAGEARRPSSGAAWLTTTRPTRRVWHTLMAVVRDDLTIAKPGHDAWDGD